MALPEALVEQISLGRSRRTQKKTNRQNRRGWWARNLTRKFDKISLTNRGFFCAAGENFRGFGDRFTLKTRFRMHPRMCFLRKIFPNLQNFQPAAGMDPPGSTTKLYRSIYWLDQISLADFERE